MFAEGSVFILGTEWWWKVEKPNTALGTEHSLEHPVTSPLTLWPQILCYIVLIECLVAQLGIQPKMSVGNINQT